jgi:large subunit ribosomal protein L10
MTLYTHHLPAWKRDEVEMIKKWAKEYAVISLVDVRGIPAAQLQGIRRDLHGKAVFRMTRNTLIEHAVAELGGDYASLEEFIAGQTALIFTNQNPFSLYRTLEKTKTKMAAKAGEVAPEDIVVSKGPTSFKPGPIVGELQQAGVPAVIDAGKVKIKDTKVIVKKGDVISKKVADVLSKLEIKPMDVGLRLQAAFYEKTIFRPGMLAIDDEAFQRDIALAARQAFNLSVNAAFPTKVTVAAIIGRAFSEAKNLGVEAGIYEKDVMDAIIARASREAKTLKGIVGRKIG